jgi:hypothetical protein
VQLSHLKERLAELNKLAQYVVKSEKNPSLECGSWKDKTEIDVDEASNLFTESLAILMEVMATDRVRDQFNMSRIAETVRSSLSLGA